MKILLDTHAFIWWDDEHEKLSPNALKACQDRSNTLVLSIASIWEMQIKIQIGKLKFSIPLEDKIKGQQITNRLEILSISMQHVFTLNSLPDLHRDPFDRLLIAQALHEKLPLISNDSLVAQYNSIPILW